MIAGAGQAGVAAETDRRMLALEDRSTQSIRRVRQEHSKLLRESSTEEVLAIAMALVDRHRWVACELICHHPDGFSGIGIVEVEGLGQGIDSWHAVDPFARYISGLAWQRGLIADDDIRRWATSSDLYWCRAALVSTVPLNLRTAGGAGDAQRTVDICSMLVGDHDDTIVKALSRALRELVI